MDYEKKYKKVFKKAKKELQTCGSTDCDAARQIYRFFPELAESEDEKIRKEIISALKYANHEGVYDKHLAWLEKQGTSYTKRDVDDAIIMSKIVLEDFNEGNGYYKVNLAYLNKKQVEEIEALVSTWSPTDEDIKSCIQMCLTDANEQRFKDYGTNLKDCLAWLEKQGQEKHLSEPIKDYQGSFTCWNNAHDFRPKHLQRCICYDKYMGGVYCYVYDDISKYWCTQTTEEHDSDGDNHISDYADYRITLWMPLPDVPFEQKPSDKVEPKFKVKYAGNEYNVFETKDIAGVTFYGIEDEPNHIDYVKAENCEIISVYAIKENGSPYPTKPAVFSKKKPKRETTEWKDNKNHRFELLTK